MTVSRTVAIFDSIGVNLVATFEKSWLGEHQGIRKMSDTTEWLVTMTMTPYSMLDIRMGTCH